MKRGLWLGFWGVLLIALLGLAALPVIWTPAVQAQDFTVPTRTPTPGPATPVPPPTDPPPDPPSDPPPDPPSDPPPPEDGTVTPTATLGPGTVMPTATPMPGTFTPTATPGEDAAITGTPTPAAEADVSVQATATPGTAATESPGDAVPGEGTATVAPPPVEGEPLPPDGAGGEDVMPTPTLIPVASETQQRLPLTMCGGAVLMLFGLGLLFLWQRKS